MGIGCLHPEKLDEFSRFNGTTVSPGEMRSRRESLALLSFWGDKLVADKGEMAAIRRPVGYIETPRTSKQINNRAHFSIRQGYEAQ